MKKYKKQSYVLNVSKKINLVAVKRSVKKKKEKTPHISAVVCEHVGGGGGGWRTT